MRGRNAEREANEHALLSGSLDADGRRTAELGQKDLDLADVARHPLVGDLVHGRQALHLSGVELLLGSHAVDVVL